jgi:hypothetical protein
LRIGKQRKIGAAAKALEERHDLGFQARGHCVFTVVVVADVTDAGGRPRHRTYAKLRFGVRSGKPGELSQAIGE